MENQFDNYYIPAQHKNPDESVIFDQGDYFFDEEFVFPMEKSQSISPDLIANNNGGMLTRCHSDSKLNQLTTLGRKGQLPIDNYDSNYSNLLFSTGEGEFNSSNQDCSESLIRPNLLNSSLIRRITDKPYKNDSSMNEYKIAYENDYRTAQDKNQKDTFIPISSLKALDRALDRVVEAMPTSDKSVMKRSIGICTSLQSNQNTTTWARVKGSKESLNRAQNNINSNNQHRDSIKEIPTSDRTKKVNLTNDKQTWQEVKDAASRGYTTWGQLKSVARKSRKEDRLASKNDKMVTSHQFVDHSGPANNLRSHSQPSDLSSKKMQRFSGTLLEIYMRARYMNVSNSMNNSVIQNFPLSPSMQELAEKFKEKRPKGWFDNLLSTNAISALSNDETQSHVIDSQSSKPDPKNLINFGAQFPPTSYLERAKLMPSPHRRPLSSAYPQYPLRVTNRDHHSSENRRRSLSSMNSQFNRVNSLRVQNPESVNSKPMLIGQNIPPVIEYPGLGPLTIPKPSRLIEAAFLSITLPDLSFLTQAAADEESNNQLLTPASQGYHRRSRTSKDIPSHACVCEKCGHRARTIKANKKLAQMKNPRRHNNPDNITAKDDLIDRSTSEPDIIMGHLGKRSSDRSSHLAHNHDNNKPDPAKIMTSSAITTNNDRDQADAILQRYTTTACCDFTTSDENTTTTTTTTSGGGPGDFLDMDPNSGVVLCRKKSKKSVTFTQNKLKSGSSLPEKEALVMAGIKIIPRNWGLYGGDPGPLAEFSSTAQEKNAKTTNGKSAVRYTNGILLSSNGPKTDIDIRYHALVNDVIKAVQVTVAYFSTMELALLKNMNQQDPPTTTTQATMTNAPHSSNALLAVVNPLLVLLNDGLLTPARNLFGSKNRSRLWNLIEESCRPDEVTGIKTPVIRHPKSSCPAGVAYHVLCEAINEVKAISTTTTNDKLKFKAFVISCLKLKALPMWLNAIIVNDYLLKRYYCDGAFLRQCKTTQRGLYADLMTHLEQLLVYTFDLQLEIEIRKPSTSITSSNNNSSSTNNNNNNINGTASKSQNLCNNALTNGIGNSSTSNSANQSAVSSITTNHSTNSNKSANFMQATTASINRQAKTNQNYNYQTVISHDTNNNTKSKASSRTVTNYSQQQAVNSAKAKKQSAYASPMVVPSRQTATMKPVSEASCGHLPQLRRHQSPSSASGYKTSSAQRHNMVGNLMSSNNNAKNSSFQLKTSPQEPSRLAVHNFMNQRNHGAYTNIHSKGSTTGNDGTPTAMVIKPSPTFSIASRMKADTPPPLPPHQTPTINNNSNATKFPKPSSSSSSFLHFRRSNSQDEGSRPYEQSKQQTPTPPPSSVAYHNLPPTGIPRPSANLNPSTSSLLASKNSR